VHGVITGRTLRIGVIVVLGLAARAGSFALGRITAPARPAPSDFTAGFQAGHAAGIQEGRALQEGQALTGAERDAATAAFSSGYRAGLNDAFAGYDGGWSLNAPYVITLAPGANGATYRIATRTELRPDVNYYLCHDAVSLCQSSR
jgi:hypothetical protein